MRGGRLGGGCWEVDGRWLRGGGWVGGEVLAYELDSAINHSCFVNYNFVPNV